MAFEDLVWLFSSNKQSRGIIRMNIAEAALLYKYCKIKCDSNLVEIGRKFGGSTTLMSSALNNGKLYSIDMKMQPSVEKNTEQFKDRIVFINSDSSKVDWSLPIGLILVDGDHSYSGVKKDVDHYFSFVEVGGYGVFHDVIGKKSELQPIIDGVLKSGWTAEATADSLLVLKRIS